MGKFNPMDIVTTGRDIIKEGMGVAFTPMQMMTQGMGSMIQTVGGVASDLMSVSWPLILGLGAVFIITMKK
jgi:hypothetical protein